MAKCHFGAMLRVEGIDQTVLQRLKAAGITTGVERSVSQYYCHVFWQRGSW